MVDTAVLKPPPGEVLPVRVRLGAPSVAQEQPVTVRTSKMRKLYELRDALKAEIEAKRLHLEGVEMAIRAADGEAPPVAMKANGVRPNVKKTLLTLLEEVGVDGLNAATAVELANRKGEKLERATVSSLLSRFKSDGVVTHDGTMYRLTGGTKPEEANKSVFN